MAHYVYVIRSINFGRFYVGMSEDPEKRLKQHNSGKTQSTKPYKPWVLVFTESFENRFEARDREKYLKSGIGREYIKEYWTRSITE